VVISRRSLLVAGAAIPTAAYGQCVTDSPEEARTNVALQSTVGVAPWQTFASIVAGITGTANNTTAPDGTTTATRLVCPAVTGASAVSIWYQGITVTAAPYAFSVWLRGAVGGEQTYIFVNTATTYYTSPRLTLTTAWQRYSVLTPVLTVAPYSWQIGADLRDGTQTSTPAQTIYAWGAQVEQGTFVTSYIPTTSTPVTRPVGVAIMSPTLKCRL
jgi:hypothetical protein